MSELENPPSSRMIKKDLVYLKECGLIELKGVAKLSMGFKMRAYDKIIHASFPL